MEGHGTAYYPIVLRGPVATMVHDKGSRQAALDEYGGEIHLAIGKMNGAILGFTTATLLMLYAGAFTALTIAFGLLGIPEMKRRNSGNARAKKTKK